MKKAILIFAILTIISLNSFSQIFPNDTATWSNSSGDMFGTSRLYEYFQKGDTIINDSPYNKLYHSFEMWDNYEDTIISSYYNNYKGALRPDNNHNKVFFIPKDSLYEVLLYDFNLEVGDTVPVWHNEFHSPIKVESIDTIVVNGISLRRFDMESKKMPESVYGRVIIEGIGSISDLVLIQNNLEGSHGFTCFLDFDKDFHYPENCENDILSIDNNNKTNYETSLSIVPNPCSNEFILSFENMNNEYQWAELTNFSGAIIKHINIFENKQKIETSQLTNGIYIVSVYNNYGLIKRNKLLIIK